MGKVKAAKVEAGEAAREDASVALVVFGRDEGGRPHASTFKAADAQLAERAAALMGMLVLPISTRRTPANRLRTACGAHLRKRESFRAVCNRGPLRALGSLWRGIPAGAAAGVGPRQPIRAFRAIGKPSKSAPWCWPARGRAVVSSKPSCSKNPGTACSSCNGATGLMCCPSRADASTLPC